MNRITENRIAAYLAYLHAEERAAATIEKYGRDIRAFAARLDGSAVTKETAAALNGFFAFMEWGIRLKPLKIQKQTFRAKEKELSRDEYTRLLRAARDRGNERLNLVLQTLCSTGIRVSELRFITVEAARTGEAEITNKGKTRTVFIPKKLKPLLLRYAKKRGVKSGPVFVTKSGRPLDRSNIWAAMKRLCAGAGVEPSKVFPHNLRHLFARLFYGIDKDITRLADLLGHSDVNTTRIYLRENGTEHRRRVDRLGLVAP